MKVGGGIGRPQRPAVDPGPPAHPDFVRVRIGIGKPPGRQPGADYVLRRPSAAERELLDVGVAEAADAVEADRDRRAWRRP